MTDPQPVAPHWAGRVPKSRIARLYEMDASGIYDEELIDDVAFALLARCESMLVAAAAHDGRATCPVCQAVVKHDRDRKTELRCATCGWRAVWEAYWQSYRGRHLLAPGLRPFCREYIERLPAARTAREKMLLIDWLIHRFHWEGQAGSLGQAGAVCLIEGRAHDVNAFLDALTLGEPNDPGLAESHRSWRTAQHLREAAFRSKVEQRRRRKPARSGEPSRKTC